MNRLRELEEKERRLDAVIAACEMLISTAKLVRAEHTKDDVKRILNIAKGENT